MTEVTAREELYEVAASLRRYDTDEKAAKALKEKVRKPFFELITEVIETEMPLAKVTETVFELPPGDTDEERVELWRLGEYPEYRVLAIETRDDSWVIALEEDPAIRKFSFQHDGYKYGRTYSMTGGGTNVEALYHALHTTSESDDLEQEARIALANAITPKQITTYELDESVVREALVEHPELVSFVQQFVDPGKPTVKLTPITKAKETEE